MLLYHVALAFNPGRSYSEAAIADWADQIQALGQQLKTIYVYFNNDQNGYAADNARALAQLL